MSKIGQVNLDLQEQAEALGFESVQEALDNGYRAFIKSDGTTKLEDATKYHPIDIHAELAAIEQAHKDYEQRRQIIIDKLEMLQNDTPYNAYKEVLSEAIEFVKEKEV